MFYVDQDTLVQSQAGMQEMNKTYYHKSSTKNSRFCLNRLNKKDHKEWPILAHNHQTRSVTIIQ